ncbi:hypothetical protein TMatcc_006275 [Talaromyces marneffei ATCC 18224]
MKSPLPRNRGFPKRATIPIIYFCPLNYLKDGIASSRTCLEPSFISITELPAPRDRMRQSSIKAQQCSIACETDPHALMYTEVVIHDLWGTR